MATELKKQVSPLIGSLSAAFAKGLLKDSMHKASPSSAGLMIMNNHHSDAKFCHSSSDVSPPLRVNPVLLLQRSDVIFGR